MTNDVRLWQSQRRFDQVVREDLEREAGHEAEVWEWRRWAAETRLTPEQRKAKRSRELLVRARRLLAASDDPQTRRRAERQTPSTTRRGEGSRYSTRLAPPVARRPRRNEDQTFGKLPELSDDENTLVLYVDHDPAGVAPHDVAPCWKHSRYEAPGSGGNDHPTLGKLTLWK